MKTIGTSPLDYYVTNQQWEFVLTSVSFLSLFAILVYLPRSTDYSVSFDDIRYRTTTYRIPLNLFTDQSLDGT